MRLRLGMAFPVVLGFCLPCAGTPPDDPLFTSAPDRVESSADCPLPERMLQPPASQIWAEVSARTERIAPSGRDRGEALTPIPRRGFVDAEIFGRLDREGVSPAPLAGDEEFLRRVTLDLTGEIPLPATVKAFLADLRLDKRDRKIDELLASPAFNDRWTLWFGDVVENVKTATNAPLYYPGRNAYYEWIRTSITTGKPYDEMVRELLSATGDNVLNPPASYAARQRQSNGPNQDSFDNLVTHSTDKFLGVPTLCISCHDGAGHTDAVNLHLASRKREQFWGMAAYFAQVRWATQTVDAASGNIRWNITQNSGGTYQLNTTTGNKSPRTPPPGKPATAPMAFLWSNGSGDLPRAGETPQQAYARMLTGQRQFAVAAANLLWREMFGLGLVEPVDGFDLARLDPQNPPPVPWVLQPSHPELLDQLARHFESGRYDLRAFLRTLARSSAYQLSRRYTAGKWNESWTPLFARHYARRLPAEVLFDALARATNQPTTGNQMTAQGLPNPTKAVSLPDPTEGGSLARFLSVFGRGNRDGIPRTEEGSILQALALLNDTNVFSRVRNTGTTTVANTLKATQKPEEITDALYLATLGRSPTSSERSTAVAHLKGGTLSQRTEDLHYALLNSLEFAFN